MLRRRCLLSAFFCLASLSLAAPPGVAQAPPFKTPPGRHVGSLQQVLEEIVWKPEQQGVLLIVSPATVAPQFHRINRAKSDFIGNIPMSALPPKSAQGLRLSALEQYFSCVAVPCGPVTVLAPPQMTVLNYDHLPAPSPYANLKPSDAFELLQGNLTKAQWQRAASSDGLGIADLDASQRDLFEAAFPATMTISQTKAGKSSAMPLGERRRGLRIRIVRRMNWSFRDENGASISIGLPQENQVSLFSSTSVAYDDDAGVLYGVELRRTVPARFKPGQLAFDWDALAASVDVKDIDTVGELVARARKATHVELYCDPRYAKLPVYLRGSQVNAGSLLKAVARGVNGTWRRVGNSYVLTDDVVGLATRQARILRWVNQNQSAGAEVDRKLRGALDAAKPLQYLQFADDGQAPSAALLEKYRQYEKTLYGPRKEGDPPPDWKKVWPVGELPSAMQAQVQETIQALDTNKIRRFNPVHPDQTPPRLIQGAVQLSFSLKTLVNIPGIGWADVPYSLRNLSLVEDQDKNEPVPPVVEGRGLPALLGIRACILNLKNKDGIESVVQATRRAGFTEVWCDAVAVSPDDLKAIAQTVHATKLNFRVILPTLRVEAAKEVDEAVDRNVLGETSTQSLAQVFTGRTPPSFSSMDKTAQERAAMAYRNLLQRQQEQGDWRDPGAGDAADLLVQKVEALRKIVPIDGVVLRDFVPPGYEPNESRFSSRDIRITDGGYQLARRLEFLGRYGIDPVDISLGAAELNGYNRLRYRQGMVPDLQIPFFNLYKRSISGRGSDNSTQLWNQFRQESHQKAMEQIQVRLRTALGDLPVWFYQKSPNWNTRWERPDYVESRDKALTTPVAESIPSAGGTIPDAFAPPPQARAGSRLLLYDFNPSLSVVSPIPQNPQDYVKGMTRYLFDPKTKPLNDWDGIVFDLREQTVQDAVSLLELLPTPEPPPSDVLPGTSPSERPVVRHPKIKQP